MIKQVKDWNKADDNGNINVPDHLDGVFNKVGMQLRFHTISGKNEIQTICDIVYGIESYFEKLHKTELPSNESGKQMIIRLTEFGFCRKDIERISGKSRQYVHKIITEQYVKKGIDDK